MVCVACIPHARKAKSAMTVSYTHLGIVVMGIDVVLLPFTTPETINFLGYQKSKFAGRISGILLIAVGVWMCFIQ